MAGKVGRPRKEIDWDQFEKLCGIQCTLIEISSWFQVSEDTIERAVKRHYGQDFADVFKQKQSLGKISVRRKMFETAMSGSPVMLIWLSKNMLGYSDKVESQVQHSGEIKSGTDREESLKRLFKDTKSRNLARELAEHLCETEKKEDTNGKN